MDADFKIASPLAQVADDVARSYAPRRNQPACELPDVVHRGQSAATELAHVATPEVVHQDADFLVLNKPHDIRMDGDFAVTVEKLVADRFPLPDPAQRYRHVHQLDFATSGCLLYGATADSTAAAGLLFEERKTQKEYLALVYGHITSIPAVDGVAALDGDKEAVIDRLKSEAAVRGLDSRNPGTRQRDDGVQPARPPAHWHASICTTLQRQMRASSAAVAATADSTVDDVQLQHIEVLNLVAATSYGEMKYKARLQRQEAGDARPIDDRPSAWVQTKRSGGPGGSDRHNFAGGGGADAAVGVGAGFGTGDTPEDIVELACDMLLMPTSASPGAGPAASSSVGTAPDTAARLSSISTRNWASLIFDVCLQASIIDGARFKQEKDAASAAERDRRKRQKQEQELVPLPSASSGAAAVAVTGTAASAPASTRSESAADNKAGCQLPQTSSHQSLAFIIDLPIAEVAADGSDFRMRIARDDGRTAAGGAASTPVPGPGATPSLDIGTAAFSSASNAGAGVAQTATTVVEVLALGSYQGLPVTKLLLTPITGRRHQLRLHTAALGHPIVGDATYCADFTSPISSSTPPHASSAASASANTADAAVDGSDGTAPDSYASASLRAPRTMLHAWRLALDFPYLQKLPNRSFRSAKRWANAKLADAGSGGAGVSDDGAVGGAIGTGAVAADAAGQGLRVMRFQTADPFDALMSQ